MESNTEGILSLLQMKMGRSSNSAEIFPPKYLLLINKPEKFDVKWAGHSVEVQLTAECAITLSRIQVSVGKFRYE